MTVSSDDRLHVLSFHGNDDRHCLIKPKGTLEQVGFPFTLDDDLAVTFDDLCLKVLRIEEPFHNLHGLPCAAGVSVVEPNLSLLAMLAASAAMAIPICGAHKRFRCDFGWFASLVTARFATARAELRVVYNHGFAMGTIHGTHPFDCTSNFG